MTKRRYVYDEETDEMVEVPIGPVSPRGGGPSLKVPKYGIPVFSQKPWDPAFEHHMPDGTCILSTQKERDEVLARDNDSEDPQVWVG